MVRPGRRPGKNHRRDGGKILPRAPAATASVADEKIVAYEKILTVLTRAKAAAELLV
jgi:hypothetical protein